MISIVKYTLFFSKGKLMYLALEYSFASSSSSRAVSKILTNLKAFSSPTLSLTSSMYYLIFLASDESPFNLSCNI